MWHLKKYVDCINTKYVAKYGTELLETNQPISLQTPEGSGHMDGAILLATR